jgi:pimeloyl-ACP methyl ester carboxylesterase
MLTAGAGDIAYTESGAGPAAVFVHGLATSGAVATRHRAGRPHDQVHRRRPVQVIRN